MIDRLKRWAGRGPGIIFPVFFLFLSSLAEAQGDLPDARSICSGNITAVPGTGSIYPSNPAFLGTSPEKSLSVGHSLPFLLGELGISSIEGILNAYAGTFHAAFSSYGLKGFREQRFRLAYGLRVAENFYAGIAFSYLNMTTSESWSYLRSAGIELGCLYRVNDETSLGLYVKDPFTVNNFPDNGPLRSSGISLGASHMFYEKTRLLTECTVGSDGNTRFKVITEYGTGKGWNLRAGVHSSPHTWTLGTRFTFRGFDMDLAWAWSPDRGIFPALLITYSPGS